MKSFLYVMVADVPMLIAGEAVFEIKTLAEMELFAGSNGGRAVDHVDWRNQVLHAVYARHLLGLPPSESPEGGAGIVYRSSPEDSPIFLLVDEVKRILKLDAEEFKPLPSVPEKMRSLFDAIYVDDDEDQQVYLFRNPMSALSLEA